MRRPNSMSVWACQRWRWPSQCGCRARLFMISGKSVYMSQVVANEGSAENAPRASTARRVAPSVPSKNGCSRLDLGVSRPVLADPQYAVLQRRARHL